MAYHGIPWDTMAYHGYKLCKVILQVKHMHHVHLELYTPKAQALTKILPCFNAIFWHEISYVCQRIEKYYLSLKHTFCHVDFAILELYGCV